MNRLRPIDKDDIAWLRRAWTQPDDPFVEYFWVKERRPRLVGCEIKWKVRLVRGEA